MSVLALSLTTVAIAEIGDKTQLLSLVLASRYRKPFPIILAILFATLINHALAAWLGVVVANVLSPEILRWVVATSFLLMAGWVLIPDKLDEAHDKFNYGAFITSFMAFFIAEIGDKTQIATSILGAQFADALLMVIIGTTLGMMIANVPIVLLGQFSAEKINMKLIRRIAAIMFGGLGITAALA